MPMKHLKNLQKVCKRYIEAGLLTNKISDDFFSGILVEKEYSPDDKKAKNQKVKLENTRVISFNFENDGERFSTFC